MIPFFPTLPPSSIITKHCKKMIHNDSTWTTLAKFEPITFKRILALETHLTTGYDCFAIHIQGRTNLDDYFSVHSVSVRACFNRLHTSKFRRSSTFDDEYHIAEMNVMNAGLSDSRDASDRGSELWNPTSCQANCCSTYDQQLCYCRLYTPVEALLNLRIIQCPMSIWSMSYTLSHNV